MTDAVTEAESDTGGATREVPVFGKLLVFVLLSIAFIAIGTYPPLRAHLRPDELDKTIEGMGWLGPVLLVLIGAFSPLLLLPRWPLAVVSGLVYGVFWGSCLANSASLLGAWLQYLLARSTLAHMAARLLSGNRWRHLLESHKHTFLFLFLFRAFPLSNFVVTNVLCGTLRIPVRTYLAASALGMIPSTILYAAWGKLALKPSGGFFFLAFFTLAFIVLGTVFARRFLTRAHTRNASSPKAGTRPL
ncbi:MAG: VTT domain-containing protein [bacterium]